ncbi:MAG: hypothetical protein JW762_04250 [Dehalococcoidales bacterium]|nr:hypothetical protein [Dehalococcoidales bacterium]
MKNLDAELDGDYLYYKLDTGEKELNAISRVIFSDYQTYLVTVASEHNTDKSILSSARQIKRTLNLTEKVGLLPIPADGASSKIPDACKLSRTLGADIISWYFFWGGLENDWTVADCVMECLSLEGKTAALVNIIHSNVLGDYPPEFNHFSDPGFKEAFAEFSVEFVNRYTPEYYFIGGEVDIYLDNHRDEIPAFKELYDYTYNEIKKASPDTIVGSVFAYHYARDYEALDIIRTLTENCDIVGYTCHPHEENFSYKNVSRGLEYLSEIKDVVPDKPYCILETCWSSSPLLDSSEDLQAEFVHDFFGYVETGGAEFVIWFSLHNQDDCTEAAQTHLEPVPELQVDEAYVKAFEEFMCSPGLIYSDGTPKKALDIWKQYTQK